MRLEIGLDLTEELASERFVQRVKERAEAFGLIFGDKVAQALML